MKQSETVFLVLGLTLPHLVADSSGEQIHELRGLVALNLPVLNGVASQEVVQLGGQHGTRHLLIPRRLLTCNRIKIKSQKMFKKVFTNTL